MLLCEARVLSVGITKLNCWKMLSLNLPASTPRSLCSARTDSLWMLGTGILGLQQRLDSLSKPS
jgi:hypothetical protein